MTSTPPSGVSTWNSQWLPWKTRFLTTPGSVVSDAVVERDLLGTNEQLRPGPHVVRDGWRQRDCRGSDVRDARGIGGRREHVCLAEEVADEPARRVLVGREGLRILFDPSRVHDHHPVRQRERLGLVVGDHQRW